MPAPPGGFDPAVFVGRTVESACHYPYQIYLHFSGDIHLRVEAEFELKFATGAGGHRFDAATCRQAPIGQIVGAEVTQAIADGVGNLRLEFAGGITVTCHRSPLFESYHIYDGTREIVV